MFLRVTKVTHSKSINCGFWLLWQPLEKNDTKFSSLLCVISTYCSEMAEWLMSTGSFSRLVDEIYKLIFWQHTFIPSDEPNNDFISKWMFCINKNHLITQNCTRYSMCLANPPSMQRQQGILI